MQFRPNILTSAALKPNPSGRYSQSTVKDDVRSGIRHAQTTDEFIHQAIHAHCVINNNLSWLTNLALESDLPNHI
ncbi:hypothetical protein BDV12DRAFT_167046 [Aspergillus spectabilis]